MTYILGLVVVGLFFLALHYFTEFDHMKKIYVIIIVLSILSVAVMYNEYNKQENQKMLDAVLKYKQGQTIKCDGKDVNSSFYTLSIGTYTFIGRENTPNYSEMISASTCQ
ncbi:hypothetical protein JHD46_06700 [Sulfurimonas sp. SAG-AH-194-C20]|nr:hypothetical protein [Sulfurimonas sp. SAG-AH-194-C20]MDF1879324.1 hypothetical protein [Sulfurimonas sp. SAG-AH-194-C20]